MKLCLGTPSQENPLYIAAAAESFGFAVLMLLWGGVEREELRNDKTVQ